uniref:Cardiolipin synthetase (EC) n=1 Tax=uncultured Thiotrichaceae bacterium TaxID=298394 RepID=A0A6S6UF41_9GAMM|nr:MAG: Cardiolipin synthetase (EC [uncultured Thiotrichaceae bacterium]
MKRGFLFAIILFALLLLAIRFVGENHYKVEPQTIPAFAVNPDTTIFKSVQALLDKADSPAESMFYPLADPHLALISRIQLADNAVESIDVQYYLFHDDDVGRALLRALVEATERGVKVRLLLDDMDVGGREGLFTKLAADNKNLEVRVFNPSWLRTFKPLEYLARFPRVTRRMHNKSFTVDKISSVVGGRNVGNEYFDVNTEVAFTDFDILASGAISRDVTKEFDAYWHSGLAYDVAHLGGSISDAGYMVWSIQLETDLGKYREIIAKSKDLITDRMMRAELKPYYDRGEVIFDRPDKVITPLLDQSGHLAPTIMKLMGSAKEKLLIASPYFIPGEVGMKLFRDLRERDVEVIILTNSLAANDVAAVHSGYMDYRRELLEIGVQLYEMKAFNRDHSLSFLGSKNASLHAKSFIVDQR